MTRALLVSLSGLPGTGKTTLARGLCQALGAVHLRIDSIEHALRAAGLGDSPGGYLAAYAIAEDNLRLGLPVVADCVNPLAVTRQAWRGAAARAGAGVIELLLTCTDPAEHRRRIEDRHPDWPGQRLPAWGDVAGQSLQTEGGAVVQIETAGRPMEACLTEALAAISSAAR